jgi:hypothetical protein
MRTTPARVTAPPPVVAYSPRGQRSLGPIRQQAALVSPPWTTPTMTASRPPVHSYATLTIVPTCGDSPPPTRPTSSPAAFRLHTSLHHPGDKSQPNHSSPDLPKAVQARERTAPRPLPGTRAQRGRLLRVITAAGCSRGLSRCVGANRTLPPRPPLVDYGINLPESPCWRPRITVAAELGRRHIALLQLPPRR